MFVLGLQGSPRKKSNTHFLLKTFMEHASGLGATTHIVDVPGKNIVPCKELIVCEKKGFCPIDDDMKHEIYPMLRRADVIVLASPIFFYNVTAQLKALIDRSQTLWARKYKLKLQDPGAATRKGFLLTVGATRGKHLFEGVKLTAKYFFDAVDAEFAGSLAYRGIEHPGDMEQYPGIRNDVETAVRDLLGDFQDRRKVVFACRENACRSQMAGAFARLLAGDRLEVLTGGSEPIDQVNPLMVEVMREKGIDMVFQTPRSLDNALAEGRSPDMLVTMGCGEACPMIPGTEIRDWDLPDPAGQSIDVMRQIRDEIEKRVGDFIEKL